MLILNHRKRQWHSSLNCTSSNPSEEHQSHRAAELQQRHQISFQPAWCVYLGAAAVDVCVDVGRVHTDPFLSIFSVSRVDFLIPESQQERGVKFSQLRENKQISGTLWCSSFFNISSCWTGSWNWTVDIWWCPKSPEEGLLPSKSYKALVLLPLLSIGVNWSGNQHRASSWVK